MNLSPLLALKKSKEMRRADLYDWMPPSPEGNLALAVLWQAVKDIRNQGSPSRNEHIDAVVFLASKRAARWFDMVGLEQLSALEKLGWSEYATVLLSDPEVELTGPQCRVLTRGINVL